MIDPDLVLPGEAVVVGVSGGPDSTALAHAVARAGAAVTVAHLDHGLRPASRADAEAVAELCRRLALPFRGERASGLRRGEAAARDARYAFLVRVALEVGARKVAVGHTADDQAETVLMRLIRGAGAGGLAGMPRRRPLASGVELVRPLLGATRAEVVAYCARNGLAWREDETNRDPSWMRNRVRHELLPLLERGFNPRVRAALLRTAGLLADDDAALDAWAEGAYRLQEGELALDPALPPAVRRRLVRRFWSEVTGLPPLSARHVEQLLRGSANLPRGWHGRRSGLRLRLEARSPVRPRPFSYILSVPGSVDVPEAGVRLRAQGEGDALVVRSRRPGDRLRPWGGPGERKLQDVLVDAKVPREERDRVAVVATREGTILWVVGVRRSEALRHSRLRLDADPFRATIG